MLVCITWYKSVQALRFYSQILYLHICHRQNEAVAHGCVFGHGNTTAILYLLEWVVVITWHSAGCRPSNRLRAQTPHRRRCPLPLWILLMLFSHCWTIQSTSILVIQQGIGNKNMQTKCIITWMCQHPGFIIYSTVPSKLSEYFFPLFMRKQLVEIMIFIVPVSFYCQDILFWWYILIIKCYVAAILSRAITQLAMASVKTKVYFNIFSDALR